MKTYRLWGSVKPFVAAGAVIATAAILVIAIYFTLLDLEWIAFLAGVLVAGVLAMVSRAARAEYAASARGAKLAIAEEKLARESEERQKIEGMLTRANAQLKFTDDQLPAMIAYVDHEGIYRYHNHAFRRWLDLPAHRVDGHHMRDALGRVVYAQVEAYVSRALSGETVRYERTQKMGNGKVFRVSAQLLPARNGNGESSGFFAVLTDETEPTDARTLEDAPAARALSSNSGARTEQAQFDDTLAQQATGLPDARDRILAAIDRNEFALYCQPIEPLNTSAGRPRHYEILIRLREEEANLIPPGAFFPLAEEHGLLPQLDRWVVSHLLDWVAKDRTNGGGHGQSVFFLNVAKATLSDPDFPEYVALQLHKRGLAGEVICFEIGEDELAAQRGDVDEFIRQVRLAGCKVALSGFGRSRVEVATLKNLPIDYLKIDGSVILHILADEVALSKVAAIHRIAKVIGIDTIAEMVEDDATMARLRGIDIEYGQGFGIARPAPLSELQFPESGTKRISS